MSFYRLVEKNEIVRIGKEKLLKRSITAFSPYKSGEVIYLFEMENPRDAVLRYGNAIVNYRKLKVGDVLYVLTFEDAIGEIKLDESQSGWKESRVLMADISIENISVIAMSTVIDTSGIAQFSEPIIFDELKSIAEFF